MSVYEAKKILQMSQTNGGFNCVRFQKQILNLNNRSFISNYSNMYNPLQQRLNTLYTSNNYTTRKTR